LITPDCPSKNEKDEAMPVLIKPNPRAFKAIVGAVQADLELCFTCQTCLAACPVNRATNRLSPLKLVRLANFGLLDELIRLPEIWYCLRCNSCGQGCPMKVKPGVLIRFLRREALFRHIFSDETIRHYTGLLAGLSRARWHLADWCRRDQPQDLPADRWRGLWEKPPVPWTERTKIREGLGHNGLKPPVEETRFRQCFQCGECRAACPAYEPTAFDPLGIFRLVNYGLTEELLASPSIWLCLGCRRCTESCCQRVSGHEVIRRLQETALAEGFVDPDFPRRWQEAEQSLYPRLVEEIDSVFHFSPN